MVGRWGSRRPWPPASTSGFGVSVQREASVGRVAKSAVNDFLGGTGEFPPNPPVANGTYGGLWVRLDGYGRRRWSVTADLQAGEGRSTGRLYGRIRQGVGGRRGLTLEVEGGIGHGAHVAAVPLPTGWRHDGTRLRLRNAAWPGFLGRATRHHSVQRPASSRGFCRRGTGGTGGRSVFEPSSRRSGSRASHCFMASCASISVTRSLPTSAARCGSTSSCRRSVEGVERTAHRARHRVLPPHAGDERPVTARGHCSRRRGVERTRRRSRALRPPSGVTRCVFSRSRRWLATPAWPSHSIPFVASRPGHFRVVAPATADSNRPWAAVALRWFAETSIRGFQGDSGVVVLEQPRPGVLTGTFDAKAHSVTDAVRLTIRGDFRDLIVRPASRGCPVRPKGPDSGRGVH